MNTYQEFKQNQIFELRPKAYAYGYSIGVLKLDTDTLAIPGDVNNPTTFGFPVLYGTGEGATAVRVASGDTTLKTSVIELVINLQNQGVRAIAADNGLFTIYNSEITKAIKVPFITSLHMIPLIADQFLGGVTVRSGGSRYLL